jgi:hypothetical protein
MSTDEHGWNLPLPIAYCLLCETTIPLDQGYPLFSAICQVVPGLHADRGVSAHPIRGRQTAPRVLSLTDHSRLKLRLPSEETAPYIALAGKELNLEGHPDTFAPSLPMRFKRSSGIRMCGRPTSTIRKASACRP